MDGEKNFDNFFMLWALKTLVKIILSIFKIDFFGLEVNSLGLVFHYLPKVQFLNIFGAENHCLNQGKCAFAPGIINFSIDSFQNFCLNII
jgi:hypothetical protein